MPGVHDVAAQEGDVVGLVVQIVGSLLVLAGFTLAQRGVLDQRSRS